jgi:hypothetical protein
MRNWAPSAACRRPTALTDDLTGRTSENRDVRIRSLAVLTALALGCLGLTACDSKAGMVAVVNGARISESQLAGYVSPNAKPITATASDGSAVSIPARVFVLQYLIRNEVFPLLLARAGSPVSESELAAGRATAVGGDEQSLIKQIADVGLKPKFEEVLLRDRELTALVGEKLTTQQQVTDALAKVKNLVTVNPRFGSWDESSLSVIDMGKKQLPSMLSFDGTMPGDVKAPTGQ